MAYSTESDWVGWVRTPPGRWRPVVAAATYADCWGRLLDERPCGHCEKVVKAKGDNPNERRKPR